MKNRSAAEDAVRFGKSLYEAGQQCLKRLYLDHHSPVDEPPSDSRRAMSEAGQRLLQLARSAFPRGVEVAGKTVAQSAAKTEELLAGGSSVVLFGAAFVAEGCEVATDILVRQKDGQLDIYEVKSGTKVKSRYLADLALQVLTIERAGHRVRAAFVLHLDKKYKYPGGDHVAAKLLRSADVSERVRRLVPRVADAVRSYVQQLRDDSVLQLPTGSFCTQPFPCPHLPACSAQEPEFPLRKLPDLTPSFENHMHEEGTVDLLQIDPKLPGLTFRQRRSLQSLHTKTLHVEPFVREELLQVEAPLHFVSLIGITEALPRFEGQKPWQPTPYAWAAETVFDSGRIERTSFAHADKGDPRPEFVRSLAKLLQGGMIVCWCSDSLASIRLLLDSLPAEKQAVRAILARSHLDMRRLLESGLYHPRLLADRSLASIAEVVIGDSDFATLAIRDSDAAFAALQKASAPRVRQATKDKLAADLKTWAEWEARTLRAVYRQLAGQGPEQAPEKAAPGKAPPRKQLPPS